MAEAQIDPADVDKRRDAVVSAAFRDVTPITFIEIDISDVNAAAWR